MKFNSVEISGFRIYNNPKNANFNFTTDKGETADFVSLFAPNGFGKTSFYDAVEWAVTNNIERFWVNNKNTEKSLSMLRQLSSGQIKLLKNHQTTNEAWVKITDSENKEFIHRDLNVAGQRATDIEKPNNAREKVDFLNVILSQEWISRFLKESNGQTRYKKFMENNAGLQKVDIYYQSVIALSKANDKKVSAIKNEIKELESKINNTSKDDLLGTINTQIDELNRLRSNYKFKNIEASTTKKEIADSKNRLSDLIADNSQITKIQKLLSNIKDAESGNENLFSRKQYFDAKVILEQALKTAKEVRKSLSDFEKLGATKNEITQNESSRNTITVYLRELIALQLLLPEYSRIDSRISLKSNSKRNNQDKLKNIEKDLETSKRQLIEEEDTNKKNERLRLKLSQELESVPKLRNDLDAIENEIKSSKKKLETQQKNYNSSLALVSELEKKVDELAQVQEEFEMGQYSETSLNGNETQIKNLKQVEKLDANLFLLKEEFKEIQIQIYSQESLNTTLSEFIASGLTIVNEQETNNCPLCEHTYENYTALANKIANNNALTASIKLLLEQRSRKKEEIERNKAKQNEFIEKIRVFYGNELEKLQREVKIAADAKDDQEKLYNEITKHVSSQANNILDLKSKFNEDSISEYEQNLKNQLSKIINIKKTDEEKSIQTKEAYQKLLSDQNQLDETIKLLSKEIESLRMNSDYSTVNTWGIKNIDGEEKVDELITQKIHLQQEEANLLDTQLKSLRKTENEVSAKLKKLNEQQLKNKLGEIVSQSSKLEMGIENYNSHLMQELAIEPEDLENSALKDSLIKMERNAQKELDDYDQYIIEVKKLKGYSENIIPYLQSEKAKLDAASSKKELEFIRNDVGTLLTNEVEKTKNYLDKKIEEFFYKDLINEIYGKIDPHPSHKEVKFIATFPENGPPSLDVTVKPLNAEGDLDSIIPNLYFSTAQINILSLSIFLASALNSKKYDCIFIDDPVQSMDSINVLSTIDLLRSIVVNNKKQIILSTHDENFHNLLKMKIPSNLFKSKYLELESFGKLKGS